MRALGASLLVLAVAQTATGRFALRAEAPQPSVFLQHTPFAPDSDIFFVREDVAVMRDPADPSRIISVRVNGAQDPEPWSPIGLIHNSSVAGAEPGFAVCEDLVAIVDQTLYIYQLDADPMSGSFLVHMTPATFSTTQRLAASFDCEVPSTSGHYRSRTDAPSFVRSRMSTISVLTRGRIVVSEKATDWGVPLSVMGVNTLAVFDFDPSSRNWPRVATLGAEIASFRYAVNGRTYYDEMEVTGFPPLTEFDLHRDCIASISHSYSLVTAHMYRKERGEWTLSLLHRACPRASFYNSVRVVAWEGDESYCMAIFSCQGETEPVINSYIYSSSGVKETTTETTDSTVDLGGFCSGSSLIASDTTFRIADGSGVGTPYQDNSNCEWTISTTKSYFIVSFARFALERNYDFLTVQDGATQTRFTGTAIPEPFTTTSNSITITFTSDGSVSFDGFEIILRPCGPSECVSCPSNNWIPLGLDLSAYSSTIDIPSADPSDQLANGFRSFLAIHRSHEQVQALGTNYIATLAVGDPGFNSNLRVDDGRIGLVELVFRPNGDVVATPIGEVQFPSTAAAASHLGHRLVALFDTDVLISPVLNVLEQTTNNFLASLLPRRVTVLANMRMMTQSWVRGELNQNAPKVVTAADPSPAMDLPIAHVSALEDGDEERTTTLRAMGVSRGGSVFINVVDDAANTVFTSAAFYGVESTPNGTYLGHALSAWIPQSSTTSKLFPYLVALGTQERTIAGGETTYVTVVSLFEFQLSGFFVRTIDSIDIPDAPLCGPTDSAVDDEMDEVRLNDPVAGVVRELGRRRQSRCARQLELVFDAPQCGTAAEPGVLIGFASMADARPELVCFSPTRMFPNVDTSAGVSNFGFLRVVPHSISFDEFGGTRAWAGYTFRMARFGEYIVLGGTMSGTAHSLYTGQIAGSMALFAAPFRAGPIEFTRIAVLSEFAADGDVAFLPDGKTILYTARFLNNQRIVRVQRLQIVATPTLTGQLSHLQTLFPDMDSASDRATFGARITWRGGLWDRDRTIVVASSAVLDPTRVEMAGLTTLPNTAFLSTIAAKATMVRLTVFSLVRRSASSSDSADCAATTWTDGGAVLDLPEDETSAVRFLSVQRMDIPYHFAALDSMSLASDLTVVRVPLAFQAFTGFVTAIRMPTPDPFRAGSLTPLSSSQHGRAFLLVQTVSNVFIVDRPVIGVSPEGSDASAGDVSAPLGSMTKAIELACADTPQFCSPIVVLPTRFAYENLGGSTTTADDDAAGYVQPEGLCGNSTLVSVQSRVIRISDGAPRGEAYANNMLCEWHFVTATPGALLVFSFTEMNTEMNFDTVAIVSATNSYVFSGSVIPDKIELPSPVSVIFRSDFTVGSLGFELLVFRKDSSGSGSTSTTRCSEGASVVIPAISYRNNRLDIVGLGPILSNLAVRRNFAEASARNNLVLAHATFADISMCVLNVNPNGPGAVVNSPTTGGFARITTGLVTLRRVWGSNGLVTGKGGLLFVSDSVLYVDFSLLEASTAGAGGLLYLESSTTARIRASTLRASSATLSGGGAVYVTGSSQLLLERSMVHDCVSASTGGALSIVDSSDLVMSESQVLRNTADSGAGGMLIEFSSALIRSSVFVSNEAGLGNGGVFTARSTVLADADFRTDLAVRPPLSHAVVVQKSVFALNRASFAGGAIAAFVDASVLAEDTLIAFNAAGSDGGGVYAEADGTRVELRRSSLFWNYAAVGGGAIKVTSRSTIDVVASTIASNVAVDLGGGLLCEDVSQASLDSTRVLGNSATSGGGLALESCNGAAVNTVVRKNFLGRSPRATDALTSVRVTIEENWRSRERSVRLCEAGSNADDLAGTQDDTTGTNAICYPNQWLPFVTSASTQELPNPSFIFSTNLFPGSLLDDMSSFYHASPEMFSSTRGDGGGIYAGSELVRVLAETKGRRRLATDTTLQVQNTSWVCVECIVQENVVTAGLGGGIFLAGLMNDDTCSEQPASCVLNPEDHETHVRYVPEYFTLVNMDASHVSNNSAVIGQDIFWTHYPTASIESTLPPSAPAATRRARELLSPDEAAAAEEEEERVLDAEARAYQQRFAAGHFTGSKLSAALEALRREEAEARRLQTPAPFRFSFPSSLLQYLCGGENCASVLPRLSSMPVRLSSVGSSGVATSTYAGGPLAKSTALSSGVIQVRVLDKYGHVSPFSTATGEQLLVIAELESGVGATLDGVPISVVTSEGHALFSGLRLRGSLGLQDVGLTFRAEPSLGISADEVLVGIDATCPGRQGLASSGDVCELCSGRLRSNGVSCLPCPPGTLIDFSFERGFCNLCPAGTIAPDENAEACQRCDLGSVASTNRTVCIECVSSALVCDGRTVRPSGDGFWWSPTDINVLIPDDSSSASASANARALESSTASSAKSAGGRGPHTEGVARQLTVVDGSNTSVAYFPNGTARTDLLFVLDPSAEVHTCLIPEACIVNDNLTVTCREGHAGALCNRCVEGYAMSGSKCSECLPQSVNRFLLSLIIFMAALIAIYLVKTQREQNARGGRTTSSSILRIFLNYLKLVTIIGSFAVRAPEVLRSMREPAESVSTGASLTVPPIQCLFGWTFAGNYLAYFTLPIILTCSSAFFVFVLYIVAKIVDFGNEKYDELPIDPATGEPIYPEGCWASCRRGTHQVLNHLFVSPAMLRMAARARQEAAQRREAELEAAKADARKSIPSDSPVAAVSNGPSGTVAPFSGSLPSRSVVPVGDDAPSGAAVAVHGHARRTSLTVVAPPAAALSASERKDEDEDVEDLTNGAPETRAHPAHGPDAAHHAVWSEGGGADTRPSSASTTTAVTYAEVQPVIRLDSDAQPSSAASAAGGGGGVGAGATAADASGESFTVRPLEAAAAAAAAETIASPTQVTQSAEIVATTAAAAGGHSADGVETRDRRQSEVVHPVEVEKVTLEGAAVDSFMSATVILLFLVYNNIMSSTFAVFDTTEEIAGVTYLRSDFRITTEDSRYPIMVVGAAIAMVIYVVGIPAAALLVLYRNRHHLYSTRVMVKYSFLFAGYRKEYVLWEGVVLARQVIAAAISVFVHDPVLQSFAVSWMVIAALVSHAANKPYESSALNWFEGMTLLGVLVTQLGSVSFVLWPGEEVAITVILALFNLPIVIIFVSYFLRELWTEQVRKGLPSFAANILGRIPGCAHLRPNKDTVSLDSGTRAAVAVGTGVVVVGGATAAATTLAPSW